MMCAWRSAGSSSTACCIRVAMASLVGARALGVQRMPVPPPSTQVAARHLPAVDAAAFHAQAPVHEVRHRLGHRHHGAGARAWARLAELRGDGAGPGARAVEQHRRALRACPAPAAQHHEQRAVVRHLVDLVALEHLRARALRGEREGRRHEARVGLAVFHAQRAAHGARPSQGQRSRRRAAEIISRPRSKSLLRSR
jgi:hypothetical protein